MKMLIDSYNLDYFFFVTSKRLDEAPTAGANALALGTRQLLIRSILVINLLALFLMLSSPSLLSSLQM